MVVGGQISFDDDRDLLLFGNSLDDSHEFDIVFQSCQRRHEDMKNAVTWLDTEGRPDHVPRLSARQDPIRLAHFRFLLIEQRDQLAGISLSGQFQISLVLGKSILSPPPKIEMRRQGITFGKGINVIQRSKLIRPANGKRVQRQPQPDRRITGNQKQAFGAHWPRTARPVRPRLPPGFGERHHISDGATDSSLKNR